MSRLRNLRVAVVLASVVAAFSLAGPALAQQADKPDDDCTGNRFTKAACEVKDELGDAIKAPFEAAGESVINGIASAFADAAVTIIGKVVGFFHDTSEIDLTRGWFMERYNFMAGVGWLVLLPMLLIAVLSAVIRQDMSRLVRSVFVYLPVSVLATFVAIWFTSQLLAITDSLTIAVSQGIGGDVREFYRGGGGSVSAALTGSALVNPMLVIIFAAILILAGLAVWIELLVRSAAIYICVLFLPLVLSAFVWPATAKWTKRLGETLVALILSKFVIVSVISLATAAFSASLGAPESVGAGEAIGRVVGGGALFLMAAFAPFALMKLVPLAEGGALSAVEGISRKPVQTMSPASASRGVYDIVKDKVRPPSSGADGAAAAGAARSAGGTSGGAGAGLAAGLGAAAVKAPGAAGRAAGDRAVSQAGGEGARQPARGGSSSSATSGGIPTRAPATGGDIRTPRAEPDQPQS